MKRLFIVLSMFIAMSAAAQDIPRLKITDIESMITNSKDEVLVINFWATFCKPCVAEIPFFISITDKYKGDKVKLTLISLDLKSQYPDKIHSFVKKHNFNTNIAWLQETNADYFCPKIDSSWSGSIPATLIINTRTGYRKFFEEETTAVRFEKELKEAIDSK